MVRVSYVGYYYNDSIKDCIFFLPKVVLDENDLVLNRYKPEEILDVEKCERMEREDRDFIYGLSVWIYRAVREFQHLNPESEIVYQNTFSRIDGSNTKVSNALIDVILSLIRFNNENRNFIMFTIKNIHLGFDKINWSKTISTHQPVIQNGSFVYPEVTNKKKQVNYDEELFVIYYSILRYVREKYGFRTSVDYNYDLITGTQFSHWLKGYGKRRLIQIKYKYFSDKALALWKHCYAFFEMSELINSSRHQNDYLLVKNFNLVFEAMIDELLSDKELKRGELSEQEDGKRVDHIYAYKGLINEDDQMYYIGDSKYYKIGHNPGDNSIYKQYTYARNVIQYNLKLFLNNIGEPGKDYLIYRDPETEGYNITPNFFISARLNEKYQYEEDDLVFRQDANPMKHFENRLFDRDTLLLQHYDVNFLFVTALYAGANEYAKDEFRKKARAKFREHVIDYLETRYQFFSLQRRQGDVDMHAIVEKHFRNIIGKTFKPYAEDDILYFSCDLNKRFMDENLGLLSELSNDFIIRDYKLGTDPRSEINHFTSVINHVGTGQQSGKRLFLFGDFENEVFLIGGYRSGKKNQFGWMDKNGFYNVRYQLTRSGAVNKQISTAISARFMVLYDIDDIKRVAYKCYLIGAHKKATEEQMMEMGYENPNGDYLLYEIRQQMDFGQFDLKTIISHAREMELYRRQENGTAYANWERSWTGTPIYMTGRQIMDVLGIG